MDGWTGGRIQVWCRRRRCRNRWEVVAEQAKKWQLPCKCAWPLAVLVVWLCRDGPAPSVPHAAMQQRKSRSCLPLS